MTARSDLRSLGQTGTNVLACWLLTSCCIVPAAPCHARARDALMIVPSAGQELQQDTPPKPKSTTATTPRRESNQSLPDDSSLTETEPKSKGSEDSLQSGEKSGGTVVGSLGEDKNSDNASPPAAKDPQETEPEIDEYQARLNKARDEAADAPAQPFFNHWLWLVVIAFTLFFLCYVPSPAYSKTPGHDLAAAKRGQVLVGAMQKFAFRFTVTYCCIFYLPTPFGYVPYMENWVYETYSNVRTLVVDWTALNVLGVSNDWVPFSGSGDSTESYVRLLCVFGISVIIAAVWSLIDRRNSKYEITRDLFHSNIAYILAITMMSYGLSKLGTSRNQFPVISNAALDSTWGDTSPMGAVWRFMGASRAYTHFAGLGEMTGTLLLLFRRTRTFGAIVTLGVMTNVVMLNFCYDVPVKINSSHLALLAICLVLKDWERISGVLFFNRMTQPIDFRPPYTGPKTIWIQRALKLGMIVYLIGVPVYEFVKNEIDFANRPKDPEYFGSYSVKDFQINDQTLDEESGERWLRVLIINRNGTPTGEPGTSSMFIVRRVDEKFKGHIFEQTAEDELTLGTSMGMEFSVPSKLKFTRTPSGEWVFEGSNQGDQIRVTLNNNDESKTRLMGRGFRWVNEVPYNR